MSADAVAETGADGCVAGAGRAVSTLEGARRAAVATPGNGSGRVRAEVAQAAPSAAPMTTRAAEVEARRLTEAPFYFLSASKHGVYVTGPVDIAPDPSKN